MNEKIVLGVKAWCTITGFTGIVTGRCEYLHGNTRCYLEPKAGKENDYKKGVWIDEAQLNVDK